jgi:hypothetical protein
MHKQTLAPSEFRTYLLNLISGGGGTTSKKIRLRQANMKFDTQTEGLDRCVYNVMHNFTYVFFIYHVK